jgi:GT2 family glycosyltransferase
VFLITILYNSEANLRPFLDALAAQSFDNWRLIAIDKAFPDGSVAILEERHDPRISLIRNRANLGFAKAANQGLKKALAAGAERVVLMNNDVSFEEDFLNRFMQVWSESGAKVITPRIMLQSHPEQAWYAGGHLEYKWVFRNVHEHDVRTESTSWREVDFATACCLGIQRDVLELVGFFDERFFVYWEDTDFCLRLKDNRIPITYVLDPSLLHSGGSSSGGEFSRNYNRLFFKSYVQCLRKHFGFTYAIRGIARLLLREIGLPNRHPRRVAQMAAAMANGLLTIL